ncbi:histidine kinase [Caulobacter henricii]|uniref:C4-dicarboxylate transport sensor protein DctB n=2 Tax=Caulobacter henricii TaxID=69395 RepID=A0A0N7JHD3_9CAUL|nr:histidine kinase [Caulobacter henricii]
MLFLAAAAAMTIIATLSSGQLAGRRVSQDLARQAHSSAVLHAAVLRSELAKYRSLPFVLAQDPDVASTLRNLEPARIDALNRKLETLSQGTGAAVIYVLDDKGMTIAASNWRRPTSFVGSHYGFRPYYQDAMRSGVAELFALGTVSRRPGLFMSRRVNDAVGVAGVVVVKVEFEALEQDWSASEPAFVADPDGVVLVTSVPDWRFAMLAPLSAKTKDALRASHQFGEAAFSSLPLSDNLVAGGKPTLVNGSAPRMSSTRFMAASTPVGASGWTVFTLTPTGPALQTAMTAARVLAFTMAVVLTGICAALLRWRGLSAARTARQEAARIELEGRVEDRTAELRRANDQLLVEMDERHRAQAHVQLMQDELVQSNKLATLGQIAAGVAHEINQPVAAIRAYADNAAVFLDRQQPGPARENLGQISSLTERIGVITNELRSFARKTNAPPQSMRLGDAIDGALLLMGARLRQHGVTIDRLGDLEDQRVLAERFRLEQVLVNLLQNAVEALEGTATPRITLRVVLRRGLVRLLVSDNGPGVSQGTAATLFIPFATTKLRGLGLGLVISRDIVAEFGGELTLEPANSPGAVFAITLRKAK